MCGKYSLLPPCCCGGYDYKITFDMIDDLLVAVVVVAVASDVAYFALLFFVKRQMDYSSICYSILLLTFTYLFVFPSINSIDCDG